MAAKERCPFERGATYRSKAVFEAFRDRFDPSERLVYFHHAISVYDSMEGWFFYVEGARSRIRTWDIELGALPSEIPFDKVEDVSPVVRAAESGNTEELGRLVQKRRLDDPFVRVALDVAVERGQARAAAAIISNAKLSKRTRARALSDAATGRQLEVARALLDAGVPAAPPAIWSAVWSGSTAIVELLLARGANVHQAGQSIASMISFCERQNHARIAEILRALG